MEFDDLPFLENIKNMAKEYNSVLNPRRAATKNDCADGYYKMRKRIYGNPFENAPPGCSIKNNGDFSGIRSNNCLNNGDFSDNRNENPSNNNDLSGIQSDNSLNNGDFSGIRNNNLSNNGNFSGIQGDFSNNQPDNPRNDLGAPLENGFFGLFDGSENVLDDDGGRETIDFEPGFPENDPENSIVDFENQYDLSYFFPETDDFGHPTPDVEDRWLYEPQNNYPDQNGVNNTPPNQDNSAYINPDQNGIPYINPNQNGVLYSNPGQNGIDNTSYANQNNSAYLNSDQNGADNTPYINPNQSNSSYINLDQNGVSYANPDQNAPQTQPNYRILYNNQFNDYTPYRENSDGTDTKTGQGGAYEGRNMRKPGELTSSKPVPNDSQNADGSNRNQINTDQKQNNNQNPSQSNNGNQNKSPVNFVPYENPRPNQNMNNIQDYANMTYRYPANTSEPFNPNIQNRGQNPSGIPENATDQTNPNNQAAVNNSRNPSDISDISKNTINQTNTNNQNTATNNRNPSDVSKNTVNQTNTNNQNPINNSRNPSDISKNAVNRPNRNNQNSQNGQDPTASFDVYENTNGGLNQNNPNNRNNLNNLSSLNNNPSDIYENIDSGPNRNSQNPRSGRQNRRGNRYTPRSDGPNQTDDYRNLLFFANNLKNVCIILHDQAALLTYMYDLTPDDKLRSQIASLLAIKENSLKETEHIFGEISPEKPTVKRPTVSRGRYINAYNMLVSLQNTLDQNFEFLINNRLNESYINSLSALIVAENRCKAILREIRR
jgi:hypothetical protein